MRLEDKAKVLNNVIPGLLCDSIMQLFGPASGVFVSIATLLC